MKQATDQQLCLTVEDGGSKKTDNFTCPVVVMTSKNEMNNLRVILEGNVKYILSVDGTFRLDCGRGVVLNIAVTVVYIKENGTVIHRTFHVVHVWCQTENSMAFEIGFECLLNMPMLFLGMNSTFNPPVGCIDHCPAAFRSAQEVWPNIRMTTCEVHVMRALKKKELAVATNREAVKNDVLWLRDNVVNDKMMNTALDCVCKSWIAMGEKALTDSFVKSYGGPPYSRFYHASSGVPGLTPNQNPLEGSFHGQKAILTMKQLYADASTFLNETMPTIVAREETLKTAEVRIFVYVFFFGPRASEYMTSWCFL